MGSFGFKLTITAYLWACNLCNIQGQGDRNYSNAGWAEWNHICSGCWDRGHLVKVCLWTKEGQRKFAAKKKMSDDNKPPLPAPAPSGLGPFKLFPRPYPVLLPDLVRAGPTHPVKTFDKSLVTLANVIKAGQMIHEYTPGLNGKAEKHTFAVNHDSPPRGHPLC